MVTDAPAPRGRRPRSRRRHRLQTAAIVGILAALLAGCGLGSADTSGTSGEDGMDHAEADRLTRELVEGLRDELGLQADGELDETVPCREDGIATRYVVRGPTPADDVLDDARAWLEARGLDVDDRRPRVDQLGTVAGDTVILQVTVSLDGAQLGIAGNSGCHDDDQAS
jgi:hypothetical protein